MSEIIINTHRVSCKVPPFLSDLNELELSRNIFEKFLNFMKICPMVDVLFHAGGWRDKHDVANSRFS
jgi:hypothetical protein